MLALHGVSHDAWDRYSERGGWNYDVLAHGFKYNLSDIQAALGIHQLHKLDHFIERRALYARMYHDAFGGMEEMGAGAGGRKRGGDILTDEAGLAHAGDDGTTLAAVEQTNGLTESFVESVGKFPECDGFEAQDFASGAELATGVLLGIGGYWLLLKRGRKPA